MNQLNIVMYHYVRDLKNSKYPNIKGLDYSYFKQQIKFLKKRFNIISMEELIAAYDDGYKLPQNALLLTFDDGYKDHYRNVFPILKEEKVQGTFFIPAKTFAENILLDVNKIHFILASTSNNRVLEILYYEMNHYRGKEYEIEENQTLFNQYAVANRFDSKETIFIKKMLQTVLPEELRNLITSHIFEKCFNLSESVFAEELYMNYDQIKCMKNNGMHIGLHGYDHYWLGNLEQKQVESDLKKSLEAMNNLVDNKAWTIGYPYGSQNSGVIDCVHRFGGILGFTTEVAKAEILKANRYIIPRLDTNDFPPKSNNYLSI